MDEIFNYLIALCFTYYMNSLVFYLVEPLLGFYIVNDGNLGGFFFRLGRNEFFCWFKNV